MSDTESGENTETALTQRLEEAGRRAEQDKADRRGRLVKGAHLTERFLARARELGLTIQENTGFHKIGPTKGPRINVAKKGGRVDLSGFVLDHPGVTLMSEEDARARHLGKVRGQLDFECDDDTVLAAFEAACLVCAGAPGEPPAPAEPAPEPTTETTDDQAPA